MLKKGSADLGDLQEIEQLKVNIAEVSPGEIFALYYVLDHLLLKAAEALSLSYPSPNGMDDSAG